MSYIICPTINTIKYKSMGKELETFKVGLDIRWWNGISPSTVFFGCPLLGRITVSKTQWTLAPLIQMGLFKMDISEENDRKLLMTSGIVLIWLDIIWYNCHDPQYPQCHSHLPQWDIHITIYHSWLVLGDQTTVSHEFWRVTSSNSPSWNMLKQGHRHLWWYRGDVVIISSDRVFFPLGEKFG